MSAALDIVGTAEIAEMTGMKQNTINVWMLRGHLPEPEASLVAGYFWRRKTITRWMNAEGKERIERARGGVAA